ncbi:hypothetical protein COT49_02700 [candidate division WWE3 bacterium CG08_land_8_20_14_0_20_40_13]|uniref:Uncharacterized protein n=1 Tax=candidate division WWE3 bacterium CG08_land_8_20_14_0_20_40_13 TaxID=1975084 RepID=A0A2H0XDJ1_UNCKA|nr:MAG: hypothetical protein COT49_02700 [candidate division WWE3 bacterium CG08_land_8_20_14_0_20_40_13]
MSVLSNSTTLIVITCQGHLIESLLQMLKHTIVANTIYQLLGKFISVSATLLVTVFITRSLGVETFGQFSIVISYIAPFYVFADFGINAIVARQFSKDGLLIANYFKSILFLRITISIALIAVGILLLIFIPYTPQVKLSITIGLLTVLAQAIFNTSQIIFQVKSRYKLFAVSQIVGSLFLVLTTFFLAKYGFGVFYIIFTFVLSNILTSIVSLFVIRKDTKSAISIIDKKYLKEILILSAPLGISLVLNTLMVNADRFLLSVMTTSASVGSYFLAYKLFEILLVIPTFFMNSVYPYMARIADKPGNSFKDILAKSVLILTALSLMATLGTIIFGKTIISLIWGEGMVGSYQPLIILTAGSVIFFITSPLSWALIAKDRQKTFPMIYGIGLLFNVIANWILIPRYNFIACAYTTVATEFLVLLLLLFQFSKLNRVSP